MELVGWSALASLEGVARLAGEPVGETEAEAGAFPPGVRGVAVVDAGEVVATGVLVEREVEGVRYASMVRVRARDVAAARPLFSALEAQVRRARATRVRVSVADAPGLGEWLAGEGYARVDAFLELRREGRAVAEPLPAGLAEAGVEAVPVAAFLAMRNGVFAGTPGAFPFDEADWRAVTAGPGYDASLVRVVLREGAPIGYFHGALRGERGEVEAIGLLPAARRRGLGRVLLRRCEGRLAERGATAFGLMVAASNRPAVRLYESEGYRVRTRRETWER
ncbi:MAG: GNAT family N-acetyltransferase [Myxococcota bacterium]